MDWPLPSPPTVDPVVLTNVPEWVRATGLLPLGTSAAWTLNSGVWCPVRVQRRMVVKRLYAFNGAAVSGNCDIGLYSGAGSAFGLGNGGWTPSDRLVSIGGLAQAGTDAWQSFDIADLVIGPGLYWIGYALDNSTGAVTRLGTVVMATPGVDTYAGGAWGALAASDFAAPNYPLPAVARDSVTNSAAGAAITYSVPLLALGGIA